MATISHAQLTDRDYELLAAIDRTPMTVEQLLKISGTFAQSFGSASRLRGRLAVLRQAGWISRWCYAAATRGTPADYYRLTLAGFRLLHGADAIPPTRRCFTEVGIAHQHHTRCLADFIVHTVVAAHRQRVRLQKFYRENTLRLDQGEESLFPDCAFELATPTGGQFNYVVELDNGTERVRSPKDVDSWQRKIRLYDQLQNRSYPNRFRVLVVTTRSGERLTHIMEAAADLMSNRDRNLFYGVHLESYLSQADPLYHACFVNHRKQSLAMLPSPSNAGAIKSGSPAPIVLRSPPVGGLPQLVR
jgi:hypothetical protein